MNTNDILVTALMAVTAIIAAGAFAAIAKYLFDRGLADQKHSAPNIIEFYKSYVAHTRKATGRIGVVFWVHSVCTGLFIAIGVIYTVVRFILPLLMGV
jgi:hypothetical protein